MNGLIDAACKYISKSSGNSGAVMLSSVPWSWIVRDENVWSAHGVDYDGQEYQFSFKKLSKGSWEFTPEVAESDPSRIFKSSVSIIQDFIAKCRPDRLQFNSLQIGLTGDLSDILMYVPGYKGKTKNNIVQLELGTAADYQNPYQQG